MFRTDLKLMLKFDTTSLYEGVSNTYLTVYGSDTEPEILARGSGYVMKNDQYLSGSGIADTGYPLGISNSFTMGLWLYPVNIGLVTNEITGDAESIIMPVLSVVDNNSNVVFKIEEHTLENNKNALDFSLGSSYSALTEEYDAEQWHHFWIVYDGSSVLIYIDGKLSSIQEDGSIPASVGGAVCDVFINHSIAGYDYNIAKNTGYLDDIFILNTANSTTSNIQRVINQGIDYFVNSTLDEIEEDGYALYFNDPSTITVTSSIDDMSYIYIGLNNGKIMRGSPLMWETRRNFSDQRETGFLGLTSDLNVSNGFISLVDDIIRL